MVQGIWGIQGPCFLSSWGGGLPMHPAHGVGWFKWGEGGQRRRSHACRGLTLSDGSFIAAPPYFTTMVLPRKR